MLAGADDGGCCTRREAVTFLFFGVSLSEPDAADGLFGVVTFLLVGGAVGLTYAATSAAVAHVCRFERGGMKRARAVAELFLASVPR
jgi:hypothetical protein